MEKIKIGVFSFSCCEGCALSILECEDELLDILQLVEIDNFREVSSYKGQEYQVAFIEGSITNPKEIPQLREIRRNAKVVVALGSCSALGGINCLKNFHSPKETGAEVYGDKADWYPTIDARPISKLIEVEYNLRGCPISKKEFVDLVKAVVLGKTFRESDNPVCVECKARGYICTYDLGRPCLGPVTRCGCQAICTSRKDACMGCRGLVSEPNIKGLIMAFKEHGFTEEDVYKKLQLFNGYFMDKIKKAATN